MSNHFHILTPQDSNIKPVRKKRRSIRRTILVRESAFIPSVLLVEEMGFRYGLYVALIYDTEDHSKVYIRVVENEAETYTAKITRTKGNRLAFTNKAGARLILSQLGAKKSATCFVSPLPTYVNGHTYYQIFLDETATIR